MIVWVLKKKTENEKAITRHDTIGTFSERVRDENKRRRYREGNITILECFLNSTYRWDDFSRRINPQLLVEKIAQNIANSF